MEKAKMLRAGLRRSFTINANKLKHILEDENPDKGEATALLELLKRKRDSISASDKEVQDFMLNDATVTEKDLDDEIETTDEYNLVFENLNIRFKVCFAAISADDKSLDDSSGFDNGNHAGKQTDHLARRIKLPVIEIKRFSGELLDWLSFWSQFQKIHEDKCLSNDDKLHYLNQAMVAGSRAARLLDSFPPIGENYEKALNCLKERFGRNDILVEVYIRELLKLILNKVLTPNQPTVLSNLYDSLETQLRALETLGVNTDTCSAMLYPLVESCLPEELLRAWQRSPNFNTPSQEGLKNRLDQLMGFLGTEVRNDLRITLATQGFAVPSAESSDKKYNIKLKRTPTPTATGLLSFSEKCVFCDGQHESAECLKAQNMPITKRRQILSSKRACFDCLKIGHRSRKCRTKLKCVICYGHHVRSMCTKLSVDSLVKESVPTNPEINTTLSSLVNTCIFLQTLIVRVHHGSKFQEVRAIIDTGSQRSYILRSIAEYMNYVAVREEKIVHGLFGGHKSTEQVHFCYDVQLTAIDDSYRCQFEALDQPLICDNIVSVSRGPWLEELNKLHISLTDVEQSSPIGILIGADVAGKLLTGRKYELKSGLVAVETYLGWTLIGKAPVNSTTKNTCMIVHSLLNQENIAKLWELDVLGIEDPMEKRSREEINAAVDEYFINTVTVDDTGRYVVNLPWKNGHPPISDNYVVAKKRLDNTIKRLKADCLTEAYGMIFDEWERLDIIEKVFVGVPNEHTSHNVHYLPHRAVVKPNSLTSKIRPVFDASSHEKGHPALNDCLDSGPNLIKMIPSVLLRFRVFAVGVVADIAKAFLQIGINAKERDCLRFIWYGNGSEIIYRHKRLVFGICSSPYLLGMTIKYHLSQLKCRSKYSAEILEKLDDSFYVDNCVTSVPNQQHLDSFMYNASNIMKDACFDLRGWEHTMHKLEFKTSNETNVLGLKWDKFSDCIHVNLNLPDISIDTPITKRFILSVAQKIYDPIGYTCPATVLPKLLIQRIWNQNLSWDQEVDVEIKRKFLKWQESVSCLSEIGLPRWIGFCYDNKQKSTLHVFCDASQQAYAAVIFLRVENAVETKVHLLQAKTRVASLKGMTIPRLELLGATIAARLYANVKESLNGVPGGCPKAYFWTDSTTVLSWIKREDEWSIFVWNRIQEIRQLTSKDDWRHVPGSENPANLPSRGCSPKHLRDTRWWEGPQWLYETPNKCFHTEEIINEQEINSERKSKLISSMLNNECTRWFVQRFSSYKKTVVLMAWVLRFINNCRSTKSERIVDRISSEEFKSAENFVFKLIQQEAFNKETLKSLRPLRHFTDSEGIVRLVTKISNRDDTEDFRHPILLPSAHEFVTKLIRDTHSDACHAGTQTVLSILRDRFWILKGRQTVKKVIRKCVQCNRYDSLKFEELSPPLPTDRVRDALVYEIVGIDMTGPLYLKGSKKVWICLFTCAVYRAVHLELVTALSADIFIEAFRRFVARRGRPSVIYCDNGTNFIGTANALQKIDWTIVEKYCAVRRIEWRFNPPTAPWWGGFWERLFGVLKPMLRKVLGRASLTYEELLTILCDCEGIINSRPLTYVSDEPSELKPLTPNMFLQEQDQVGVPDLDKVDSAALNKRARFRQQLRLHLRRRFRNEYLGQLKFCKQRTKPAQKLKSGDVVLIGDDHSKRLNWPLARILELIPAKDNKVRLVRLQTANGQMLRPIQRIYPLECDQDTAIQISNGLDNNRRFKENGKLRKLDNSQVVKITQSGRKVTPPERFL